MRCVLKGILNLSVIPMGPLMGYLYPVAIKYNLAVSRSKRQRMKSLYTFAPRGGLSRHPNISVHYRGLSPYRSTHFYSVKLAKTRPWYS